MKRPCRSVIIVACVVAAFTVWAHAQHPSTRPAQAESAVRFAAVDVVIDSGDKPLAAYQFELTANSGAFKIVGVEGGEHAAFAKPPYYDPAALSRDRIIIAAFNTGRDLPKGKTRVARIHVRISGNEDPQYDVKLAVAASIDGEKIPVTATWSKTTAASAAKQ
jgi:hypothetical protein